MTAWSPLAGGVLTGKYAEGKAGADARMNSEMMKGSDRADGRRCRRRSPGGSREVGRSPAQVSLAWLRQRPGPGDPHHRRPAAQFTDNLACLDLKLGGAQLARLDAASQIELGFPHDFYSRDLVKTFIFGGFRDLIDR